MTASRFAQTCEEERDKTFKIINKTLKKNSGTLKIFTEYLKGKNENFEDF